MLRDVVVVVFSDEQSRNGDDRVDGFLEHIIVSIVFDDFPVVVISDARTEATKKIAAKEIPQGSQARVHVY